MRWQGRRRSSNIEDRRGRRVSRGAIGGGIGGLVILLVATFLGIDPSMIETAIPQGGGAPATEEPYQETAEEGELRAFASVVLAETETTWHSLLAEEGGAYRESTLVLFSGAVESACGFAQAATGPFYCPADENVYLDFSFFDELRSQFNAPGDFAQAYVIAHEVGHHVQTVLGISGQVHQLRSRSSQEEANALSVLQELQADCFAGIWAHHAQSQQLLESGDIQEGLAAASAVGDDRLQQQSQGYVVPESFTHGSSAQRMEWFQRGLVEGSLEGCDTFNAGRF